MFEVPQILVVHDNCHQVFHSCEVMSLFLEHLDDCQELPVVDVIISFCKGEGSGMVGTGVKVSVGGLLHKYPSSGGEGGIGHDIEWPGGVRHLDYQGREEHFLELYKCVVLFLSP